MSANPVFFVDGPPPAPVRHRLIDVPGVLVRNPDPHWQLGVRVWSYPSDVPIGWDPCSEGTYRPKEEAGTWPLPEFSPIVAYVTESCSTVTVHDDAAFVARARLVFDAGVSGAVEQQLVNARWVTTNPYLADSPTQVNGGAAVAPVPGLAALENELGGTARGGIIHADPATAVAWAAEGAVVEDSAGVLRTVLGTPVAVEQGLIGAVPDGEGPLTFGLSWAWVTGPVRVLVGEPVVLPSTMAEALDRELNELTYRVEQAVLPYWDTVLNTAVLIDWNP